MIYTVKADIILTNKRWLRNDYKTTRKTYIMVEADNDDQAKEITEKQLQIWGYDEFNITDIIPIANKSILKTKS